MTDEQKPYGVVYDPFTGLAHTMTFQGDAADVSAIAPDGAADNTAPGRVEVADEGDTTGVVAVVPSVEDVMTMYDPPPASFYQGSDPGKEVVAIGTAVYQAVIPSAYDSHRRVTAYSAWDLGPNNLWILPSRERMAYPFNILYVIASLFKTEKRAGREADWLFWHDDDVVLPPDIIRKLRSKADPWERPFIAAPAYDRNPPYKTAVWQLKDNGHGLTAPAQWEDPPESGLHRVTTTGLCAALFHRSFFKRVPQPWFVSVPPQVSDNGFLAHKVNTDGWLSQQCFDHDMPVYVDCDVEITHMGSRMPVNRRTVKSLREVFPKDER